MDKISFRILRKAYKKPISYERFSKITHGDPKGTYTAFLLRDKRYIEPCAGGFKITRAGKEAYEDAGGVAMDRTIMWATAIWGAVTGTVAIAIEIVQALKQ